MLNICPLFNFSVEVAAQQLEVLPRSMSLVTPPPKLTTNVQLASPFMYFFNFQIRRRRFYSATDFRSHIFQNESGW